MDSIFEPTIKEKAENTLHNDGTISYFDIFEQRWRRVAVDNLTIKVLASFNEKERQDIRNKQLELYRERKNP